jgi:hypothetical protein
VPELSSRRRSRGMQRGMQHGMKGGVQYALAEIREHYEEDR